MYFYPSSIIDSAILILEGKVRAEVS
jgi:hypothetical protein